MGNEKVLRKETYEEKLQERHMHNLEKRKKVDMIETFRCITGVNNGPYTQSENLTTDRAFFFFFAC